MESFKDYGLAQFAIGNAAKFRAIVALALGTVAKVQGWDATGKTVSKVECDAALAIAFVLDKVPETSARRVLSTVSGLVTQLGKNHKDTLASVKEAMAQAESAMDVASACNVVSAVLQADGVENLSFLEAYARKGKPGLAAIAAETAARVAEVETRAAMTAEQAETAAKEAADEATAKAADVTPRAKAAKQAGAILGSLAKHGDLMTNEELAAIASLIAEKLTARLSVAVDLRANDLAAEATAKAEAAAEKRAEVALKKAA